MAKAIEELRSIIQHYNIDLTWLADRLGGSWHYHKLYYRLNYASKIDADEYSEIMGFLEKHNFTQVKNG